MRRSLVACLSLHLGAGMVAAALAQSRQRCPSCCSSDCAKLDRLERLRAVVVHVADLVDALGPIHLAHVRLAELVGRS